MEDVPFGPAWPRTGFHTGESAQDARFSDILFVIRAKDPTKASDERSEPRTPQNAKGYEPPTWITRYTSQRSWARRPSPNITLLHRRLSLSLRILRRTRIVAVAIPVTNLPIRTVDEQFAPIRASDFTTNFRSLSLRPVRRKWLLSPFRLHSPSIPVRYDMNVWFGQSAPPLRFEESHEFAGSLRRS